MRIADYLNDNTLIICPREVRLAALGWLNENRLVRSVKFMSLEEYRRNYYFDYDERAVLFLCRKLQCKVSVARMYLDNLCYVEDRDYGNEKLNRLVEIRRELEEGKLLIHNPLFHSWLKKVRTVVYGYGKLDSFSAGMIDGEIIEYLYDSEREFTVNEFDNLEEEVEWLFNSIVELLNSGTDINNIFVTNLNDEYEAALRRFEEYYGIRVDYHNRDSIVGTPLVRQFMSWIGDLDHQQIYEKLHEYSDSPIYDQLIHVLNKYIEHDLKDVRELIHEDLLNTRAVMPQLSNVVRPAEMFKPLKDDEHLFVLSFNDAFPKMKTDTDYISDNIKSLVALDNSERTNLITKQNTLGYLSTVKNLHLSYCLNSSFSQHGICTLADNLKVERPQPSYAYSEKFNRTRMYYQLEDYLKYRQQTDILPRLYGNYQRSGYLEFDNTFKGLSEQQKSQLKKPMLSYTSMNEYNLCSFAYYLSRQLKIDLKKSTFYLRLGELFHDILEKCSLQDLQGFEQKYDELSLEMAEGVKEEFFLKKLKPDLKKAMEVIFQQKQHSMLNGEFHEKDITWKEDGQIAFSGKIDKVMYFHGPNQTLTVIVDYKTGGSITFVPELTQYGLSMQLPCYLFLLDNMDDSRLGSRQQIIYGGIYLQHILPKKNRYDESKSEDDYRREEMKLDGYSLNDVGIMQMVDDTLQPGSSSNSIRSLSLTKAGVFDKRSRIKSAEEMRELIAVAEREIRKAREAIADGQFAINPKYFNGKNLACTYCQYKDVCYHRYEDNVYLDNIVAEDGEESQQEVEA